LHLKRLRSSSPQEEALYGEESVPSKLSRYEATTKRQPYRARLKLERRQAARRGAALTSSQVMDLEVSGMPEEAGAEIRDSEG
jgi:hypothetical protein